MNPDENEESSDLSVYVSNASGVMTADNFNANDAAAFAALSYVPFEDVMSCDSSGFTGSSEPITVSEYAQMVLEANSNGALQHPLSQNDINLLNSMSLSDRYSNLIISNVAASDNDTQWAAMTIETAPDANGESSSVVAFRGTEGGSERGWGEDLELGYDFNGNKAQQLSADYLRDTAQNADSVIMCGHSKGGNDAVSAYVMNDSAVRDKVSDIYNYDGPGVCEEFELAHAGAYSELDDKVHNYYPDDSVVGQLLNDTPGDSTYVKADHDGINVFGEHDLHSWNFDETNGMVETEQSPGSKAFNHILDGTMSHLSLPERYIVSQWLNELGFPAIMAGIVGGSEAEFQDRFPGVPVPIQKALLAIDAIAQAKYNPIVRAVLAKAIVLTIIEGFKELIHWDEIKEKISEVIDFVKSKIHEYFDKLISFVDSTMNAIYDKICEFRDFVCGFVESVVNGFCDFLSSIGNWLTGRTVIDDASFSVVTSSLESCADEITSIVSAISDFIEQISDANDHIRANMDYVMFWQIPGVIGDLQDSADVLTKLKNVLEYSVSTYTATENSIKNKF